jgi:maltose O-acetyltransferase
MGGGVEVGKCTLVGVGVTIAPSVEVGESVIISPGSTVMEDLPSDVIVEGNPAEVIGSRN